MSDEEYNILDKLKPYKSNKSFKVPESYFEELPSRVLQRIKTEKTVAKKSIIVRMRPWFSVAAILIVGLILYHFGVQYANNKQLAGHSNGEIELTNDVVLSELSDIDLMEYLAKDENFVVSEEKVDLTMGLSPEDLESLVLF